MVFGRLNTLKYTTKHTHIEICFIVSEDSGFVESNKMHQINGYMYGNLQIGLSLCKGDKVLWHAIGMGTEVDMHTVYFHGNSFEQDENHKDTVNVLPG